MGLRPGAGPRYGYQEAIPPSFLPPMSPRRLFTALSRVWHFLYRCRFLLVWLVVCYLLGRWSDARDAAAEAAERARPNPWQVKYAARNAAAESTKKARTPEELKALFAGFDEETSIHVVHSDELRDAVLAWYAQDLGLALSMSEALPEKKRYFVFRWGEGLYLKDPGLFLSSARKYLDVYQEHDVSLEIFKELGKTDAAKGLALLPDVKVAHVRNAVIPALFRQWAARDAAAARESAASLESPRERRMAEEATARAR